MAVFRRNRRNNTNPTLFLATVVMDSDLTMIP